MTKEQQIEERLIEKLTDLKYIYRPDIRDKDGLNANFREKFQELNRVNLSDSEFERLKEEIISADVFASAQRLRSTNTFEREDGTPLHYTLVNTRDWCKNTFEVINQLRINTENSHQRYDVILLINGVPVVQIELKGLTISPRRAMEQIVEYKNDTGNGYTNSLLCFMQLFIVSNQNNTIYFANNNNRHFSFNADERFLPIYQFAEKDNTKVTHLDDFSDKFLAKCTLGEMISRYMVLVASEQKMLMMRPYQIYAVKEIKNCIDENRGNGYIWHTTGSGKTLTSFKASTLLKDDPTIEKCLFVVDRKDLDRQTREEFNKFQDNCVEENTNTRTLVNRLLSDDYSDKVIVTTIQKLGLALDEKNARNYREELEELSSKRIVFIFDECHRSQFGDNHKAIKAFFPNSQLFGFTGTPIFPENSNYRQITGQEASYKTTEDIFQKELHSYTITNAIEDKNVLRFNVEYYKPEGESAPRAGQEVKQEAVVKAILDRHDRATSHRRFNAVFATASINHAIEFHRLFKEMQAAKAAEDETFKPLNIACVFSPPAQALSKDGNNTKNVEDIKQLQEDLPQEKIDNSVAPDEKKEALKAILTDYNKQFSTETEKLNFDINNFDDYYKDVQQRIKDHQYEEYAHSNKIDIVIVVDMLLTGFDSKYLNTLYVDKNLKFHGLIQAFSRTNRVLNDTKPYGTILDFRGQQDEVDTAIKLFSGTEREGEKEIWLVDPAPKVIETYKAAAQKLNEFMESQGVACTPDAVYNLKGDAARAEFVSLFKEVQRNKTQLDQYTDLSEDNTATIADVLADDLLRGFRGAYLETAKELKALQSKPEEEVPTEVQELDFEFVLFASAMIDYDYIMGLISRFTLQKPGKITMTRDQLIGIIKADSKFSDEWEEIQEYVKTLEVGKPMTEQEIRHGYTAFKEQNNSDALVKIAEAHELNSEQLLSFVDRTMKRMIFDEDLLSDLFETFDLGWKERTKRELALMDDLTPLLQKLADGREISGLSAYEE